MAMRFTIAGILTILAVARLGIAAAQSPVAGTPTNLGATVSGRTVTLTWTAAPGDPTTYIIEAGSGPGLSNIAVLSTGSLATSFTASDVPNGTYYVRVRSANAAGTSAPSNEVTIIVGAQCPLPRAPYGLTVRVSGSTITLSWGASDGAASHQVEVGSRPGLADLLIVDVGRATTVSGTAPAGTYYFRVRGNSPCGQSGPSNEASVRIGGATTITFDDLRGATFTSYTELGFTVDATGGSWIVAAYGNPGPAIHFQSAAGATTIGEITVTAAGSLFSFVSVDLYSSTTPIPYTFSGLRGSTTVFESSGIVPITFGRFANVPSPSAAAIDTLVIKLTNVAAPCCANPMGVDNITLSR